MVSFFSVTFLALAYISCLVNASPLVVRDNLDVAAPPITYPTQGVVWTAGQTQTVKWDISNLPAQITNPIGQVVLGWIDSTGGYNLQLNTPLASGFSITAGSVSFVVPSGYPNGNSYIVSLIGSADNISPTFTITSGGGSPAAASPPSTTSTPPAQPTSVPGTPPTPSTTPGSGTSIQDDVVPPSSTPSSHPSSVSSSSTSSTSNSSPSPSGTSESSNSTNAAWVNKPVSTIVVSLLAASLVTLLL